MTDSSTPQPGYVLQLEERSGYLYAHVTGGPDFLDLSRRFWSEIAVACRRTGARKLLVEAALFGTASVMDVYQLVSELLGMGFASIKIAYVNKGTLTEEIMRFAETVALNRGAWGRVFTEVALAEQWLLAAEDPLEKIT